MHAGRYHRSDILLFTLALLVLLGVRSIRGCRIGSGSECEKAPFVPGHNLAGEGFDVVRMRRTGAYVINVKAHLADNHTCTLCPNRFQDGQVKTPKLSLLFLMVSSINLNSFHLILTNNSLVFLLPCAVPIILPSLSSSDSEAPSCSARLASLQPLQ